MGMVLFGSITTAAPAQAQNFKSKQKTQEKTIKAAYKAKKVTELEYEKLMKEQTVIKETIAKYEADDVWTSKEKNAIHDKLERAERRLRRYKTNGEVY